MAPFIRASTASARGAAFAGLNGSGDLPNIARGDIVPDRTLVYCSIPIAYLYLTLLYSMFHGNLAYL